MQNPLAIAAITETGQWLGYWGLGNGDGEHLFQQLQSVLQSVSLQSWKLVLPSADGPWLSLSADGLPRRSHEQPDAWVQVDGPNFTLGRQGFGRVPLYWLQQDQAVWFATCWHWLLPLVLQPVVSVSALYGYSCFSYIPTPLTAIEGISAIPAGMDYTWHPSPDDKQLPAPQARSHRNWPFSSQFITQEQPAISQLQTLLRQTIRSQTADLHNEPVGVLLSGGLDSSTVAALLVQAGIQVRAFSLDFGDGDRSEYAYAAQVAQALNIPLTRVQTGPKQVRQALGATVRALDLPFGDSVTVPLYLLTQAASQQVRVIFNGEGGDQLFAGWTNKPLIVAQVYAQAEGKSPAFVADYLRTFHRLWGYEAQVFQPTVQAQIQGLRAEQWLHPALENLGAESAPLLHRLRRASLMLKGAQNIQPRATALAAAHGLQVRSPFCDPTLAAWTFQLADELVLQAACEKYILKRAVEAWLPPDIVWREKRGMGVPLTSWCLNELWHDLGDWLNPGVLQAEGIWLPDLGDRIVRGQLGGIHGRRIGEILWLLIVWQRWRVEVLGESAGGHRWNHPFWLPPQVWKAWRRGEGGEGVGG
jgi:asparagine synthase (glutamine-hydrolysing)